MTESLKFPERGAPLLPHMTDCTVKLHRVTEFEIVKSEQFTDVPSVVFGHLPQFSDKTLKRRDGQFCVWFQANSSLVGDTPAK